MQNKDEISFCCVRGRQRMRMKDSSYNTFNTTDSSQVGWHTSRSGKVTKLLSESVLLAKYGHLIILDGWSG